MRTIVTAAAIGAFYIAGAALADSITQPTSGEEFGTGIATVACNGLSSYSTGLTVKAKRDSDNVTVSSAVCDVQQPTWSAELSRPSPQWDQGLHYIRLYQLDVFQDEVGVTFN